jgi:hypothetical protein
VREAGPIFSILEQSSQERAYYFAVKLSVSEEGEDRPDHTRWFTYPVSLDKAVRSSDFANFSKVNLFELGAQIRQLKEEVEVSAFDSPPPGTEFNAEQSFYHLTLLNFISFWIEALGFTLEGKAGFDAAFRALFNFCQLGAHYRGTVLESHVLNMRRLYQSMQQDLHASFLCFWPKRLSAFNQSMEVDSMFLQSGNFYSTLRLLKDDASYLKRLSRLGVIESPAASLPSPDANLRRKRPRQYEAPVLRLQAPRSTSLPSASASASSSALLVYEPAVPVLGSFSWAIKEDAEVIKVLGFKYAKLPIL